MTSACRHIVFCAYAVGTLVFILWAIRFFVSALCESQKKKKLSRLPRWFSRACKFKRHQVKWYEWCLKSDIRRCGNPGANLLPFTVAKPPSPNPSHTVYSCFTPRFELTNAVNPDKNCFSSFLDVNNEGVPRLRASMSPYKDVGPTPIHSIYLTRPSYSIYSMHVTGIIVH